MRKQPHRASTTIADEAAEWLATLTDSACTEEEQRAFLTWLRRSNLHVEEFLRISALTHRLCGRGALPPADVESLAARAREELSSAGTRVTDIAPRSAVAAAGPHRATRHGEEVRRAAAGTEEARHASPSMSLRGARRAWLAPPRWLIAASVVIVAVAVLLITREPGPPTYATSVGEIRSITLEDGSIVELNTRSTLRAKFTPKERRVELLSGEAVFKVAGNPSRPFRVVAGSAEIVAVGTAFNVYAQDKRTVVTVLEGRVRVQEVELAGGEQAIVVPHQRIARAKLNDPQRVTSWRERRLVFDETPLADAAAEFARYDARAIQINDAELASLHITGVFDATDPASLVQFVQAYGSVSVRADVNGWTLSSIER